MRIVHLSDIHIWRWIYNPFLLLNKRAWGVLSLLAGRARRFRLERLDAVVRRVKGLAPDHLLITGDLTTTASPAEFRAARHALAGLLAEPEQVTILPGNHDRYTMGSVRSRLFEATFEAFAPPGPYPWLRSLDPETAILGLDPTQAHFSARGYLPPEQLAQAAALLADPRIRPRRLIVASHYPVAAPPGYTFELATKRIKNAEEIVTWLATIGPHLYCCGHVHAAWAFVPDELPNQLCVNAGAPLMHDVTGLRTPGFLQIDLADAAVSVTHHAWVGYAWEERVLHQDAHFFEPARQSATPIGEGG